MATQALGASPESDALAIDFRQHRHPRRPTVAITIDGCDPRDLDDALDRGLMPRLAEMRRSGGAFGVGLGQMPSFTTTDTMSVVTGGPPVVLGLPGNHDLAPDASEVQWSDPSLLHATSIRAALADAGCRLLMVTAKDEVRLLLANGGVPTTSAEKAHEHPLPSCRIEDIVSLVGRRNPGPFEWDMCHYAIEIGVGVSPRIGVLDLVYLSTTDVAQHAEGPGGPMADRYFRRFDHLLGDLLDLGRAAGTTADHGMNPRHDPDGTPRVHSLDDGLATARVADPQVIPPIADPCVVHHGALGPFARVHVGEGDIERARRAIGALVGVEEALTRTEAAAVYRHPADRIGDLSAATDARTALAAPGDRHDLSVLAEPLRSHGGRHERIVPILVSHRLEPRHADALRIGARTSEIHDLFLNGVAARPRRVGRWVTVGCADPTARRSDARDAT